MTKPHVSTVLSNGDDDPSIIDGLFAKLDLIATSAAELPAIDVDVKPNLISVLKTRRILQGKVQENFLSNVSNILPPTAEPNNTLHTH
jgi:hypothetical protein